jgi:hypothetical protein
MSALERLRNEIGRAGSKRVLDDPAFTTSSSTS